ncbi:MAG: Fe-S cluster assembly protein SufD [Cytophagales bacterium]|nr:MAG: Fe-S cluster assembly protein SufD [Cytophagales bacterium]
MNTLDFRTPIAYIPSKTANPTFLETLQQKSAQALEALSFPTTKDEEWKYTNLQALTKETYAIGNHQQKTEKDIVSLLLPLEDCFRLVFINGFFQPHLSSSLESQKGISIMPLATAFTQKTEIVAQYMAQALAGKDEYFTAMNTILAKEGVFIHLEANVQLEKPIVLYALADSGQEANASLIRNLIVAEKNSQVTFIEKFDALGDHYHFDNTLTEFYVQESAIVQHYLLQTSGAKRYQIHHTQVHQQKHSNFTNYTFSFEGAVIRNNLNLLLDGEFCEGNMFGLYKLEGKSHVDNHTSVDHLRPNCQSNEFYKGVLSDYSKAVFNGKIYVRPQAQKTNAYQQNRNVLLSEHASVNAKPQLEIWADDVKCSHGAATGKLNEDALFYLRARGIEEQTAKVLLVQAFANEVVEKIPIVAIKDYLHRLIDTV